MSGTSELKRTPLHRFHQRRQAKFSPFAGYDMPVQYAGGIIAEHKWTRSSASLFDISHMGQIVVRANSGSNADAGLALESLIPGNLLGLPVGRQTYGLLTSATAGILDDLMVSNWGDHYLLVVNASRKEADFAHISESLGASCTVELASDRAAVALQGPAAETALQRIVPNVGEMRFLDVASHAMEGHALWVSRSGYSGEDGFEISMPDGFVESFCDELVEMAEVEPAGLGARDTLRLESGLCLYGNDIDAGTSPIEAGLAWAISPVRRPGGERRGGYLGQRRIERELIIGPSRRRVGLRPEGRAPMRRGTELLSRATGELLGVVTSGGFGPSFGGPVSMGYVRTYHADAGAQLLGKVRGRSLPVEVVILPFVRSRYRRKKGRV